MANWEELPQVILELIVRRLATEESLAIRQVCTSWRTTAAKETYNAKSKVLWLMIYSYNRIAEFSNPSTGRIYPVQLPGSYCQTLSTRGWILVANGYSEHRITNPLSCISIELPALEKLQHELHHIHMIDLSRSISLSRYSVMTSYATSPGLGFVFLRSGEDAWAVVIRAMPMPWCTMLQLIFYHGLFVALDSESLIMTLNEKKESHGIRVFKVDMEKGTEEEVKSLGNISLFLNGNSSFSVEFNAESCLPGLKPNRVYCADYEDDQMNCYSMEDRKFVTYLDASSSCLFDPTSNCLLDPTSRRHIYEAEWFQPDF
ncbi:hypothetical protein ACJRO7_020936 [Eucalyptus globulus]|uniref:F-box domain-containing protein n=1 Tax=Eucalyptus globulus TaxID=34317 RepID=A0ABD3KIY1_EUCGL